MVAGRRMASMEYLLLYNYSRAGRDEMTEGNERRRFLAAQLLIGGSLTLLLTFVSIAIADHETTPQFLRYIISPGFVLGLRFMAGRGFFDALGSFGRIAFTVNMIYFG